MPFIRKKESSTEVQFIIDSLPKPGFYKLQLFAAKKPKKRGKLRLPLVASLLIDYQITTNKEQTKFQGKGGNPCKPVSTALIRSAPASAHPTQRYQQ